MEDRLQIDRVHALAICTEIGERLYQGLRKDKGDLPASLDNCLHRLREQEDGLSTDAINDADSAARRPQLQA